MRFASETTTYMSRVVQRSLDEVLRAVEELVNEGGARPNAAVATVSASRGRLFLARADEPVDRSATPVYGPAWCRRASLRSGRRPAHDVVLEVAAWSATATEVALRYCDRRLPSHRYFVAAHDILDALAFELDTRLGVEGASRFLRAMSDRRPVSAVPQR